LTKTETAGEALERKLEPPEYLAVRLCFPTGSEAVESFAKPEEFTSALPRTVDPFRNSTFPSGLLLLCASTLALRTKASPVVTALEEAARLVTVDVWGVVTVTETVPDLLDR
jgi:hypothetical protein